MIPIQDTLNPIGKFFVVDTEHIGHNNVRLDVVINSVQEEITALRNSTYTKADIDNEFAEVNSEFIKINSTLTQINVELSKKVDTQSGYGLISDADKSQIQATKTATETLREDLTATQSDVAGKASSESVSNLQAEMAVQEARMDQLVGTVPPGSADEVADARVDETGKTWPNLGDHIRNSSSRLKEHLESIDNAVVHGELNYYYDKVQGNINSDGQETDVASAYKSVDYLVCSEIASITVNPHDGTTHVAFYDEINGEKVFAKRVAYPAGAEISLATYKYIRPTLYVSGGSTAEKLASAFTIIRKSAIAEHTKQISEIEEKIEKIKLIEKCEIAKSINLVKGSQTVVPYEIDEIKANIDLCSEMGVTTINASCLVSPMPDQQVAFEAGEISIDELQVTICPSADVINQATAYALERGLRCCVLQIHSNWLRSMMTSGKMTFAEMTNLYTRGTELLLSNLNKQFDYVGLFNEYSEVYLSDTNNRNDIFSAVRVARRYTKVGLAGDAVIDHTLINNVDVYLPHTYIQPFVYFGKYSNLSDAISKVDSHPVWERISHVKNYRPDLPVIASEFGTQSGWECVFNPGTYHGADSFTLEENGRPQVFYLEALMIAMNKYGVELASYWWTIYGDAKKWIKKYNEGRCK